MHPKQRTTTLFFSLALLAGIVGTATYAEQGVVIDKTTGKPIPGAIVLATWYGQVGVFVQNNSTCYKAELAVTDEQGRFEVSAFSGNLNPFIRDRNRSTTVLVRGYREAPSSTDLRVVMEPRTGSKSEQFEQLPAFSVLDCPDQRRLLPFLKALHDEMSSLAETEMQRKRAAGVLLSMRIAEMGFDQAMRRLGPGAIEGDTQ